MDLKGVLKSALLEELKTREGVNSVDVMVEDYYQIATDAGRDRINGEGPVVILVVED